MPVSIANGLLSSREEGGECLKEFMEKQLLSPEKGFYKTIKRSSIQITIVKKKKPTEISILTEDWQVHGVFFVKYPVKKEVLTTRTKKQKVTL